MKPTGTISVVSKTRKIPYTAIGIKRLSCIRCGATAYSQWQVCADNNNYRPLCAKCDVELNALVLNWMKLPNATALIQTYTKKTLDTKGNACE